MSQSQLGQDLAVLKFYNNRREGYYVEVGASDGINLSNTYLLDISYGWKGICVEPIPDNFNKLIVNRPSANCSDCAVYNASDLTVSFDIANNYDLLSGITTHIDAHRSTVNANKTTINVKTITLTDLLDKYDAPSFIEYLSLDTEGSEYEILKVFNFDKYRFGLIDVEHNGIEPRRSKMRALLLSNGYVYIRENRWDDCYKHSSLV